MPDTTGVQSVSIRNVYPFYAGGTLGQAASAPTPYAGPAPGSDKTPASNTNTGSEHLDRALAIAPLGKPLPFWFLLIALIIGLGIGARHLPGADASDFKNIKLSAYNILIISFAAIIGIAFWKVVFTRFPVPGLTSLINAV